MFTSSTTPTLSAIAASPPAAADMTPQAASEGYRMRQLQAAIATRLEGFRRQFLDAAEQERRRVRRCGPSSSYDARAGLA